MKRKKIKMNYMLEIGVMLILLAGILSSCSNNKMQGSTNKEFIKIGVITPLTGDAAIFGDYTKKGLDLAVEEINNKGGIDGQKIKLIYEDDQLDSQKSVNAVNKLINIDKVDAVIYSSGSGPTLAGLPILEKQGIPTIVALASNPAIRNAGRHIFRVYPSDTQQAIKWIDLIQEKNYKNPVMLYVNNAWGKALKDYFKEKYQKEIFILPMPEGTTDVKTELAKIEQHGPDSLILPCYPTDCITTLKQIKELNMDIQIITGDAFYNQEYLNKVKDQAEGLLITHPKEGSGRNYEEFSKKYTRKYNKDVNIYSAYAYDTLYTLYYAFKDAKTTNKEAVTNALNRVNFLGATGLNKFDSDGEVSKNYAVAIVKNNKFVPYET